MAPLGKTGRSHVTSIDSALVATAVRLVTTEGPLITLKDR